jgi:hypothetical protein
MKVILKSFLTSLSDFRQIHQTTCRNFAVTHQARPVCRSFSWLNVSGTDFTFMLFAGLAGLR